MSQDEEQNRRLKRIEDDATDFKVEVRKDMGELKAEVSTVRTNQALVVQSIGNLETQVGTGMLKLGDDMKEARQAEQAERASIRKDEKDENDRRERLLMKVFGLIASVITLAGAVAGGGAYLGMQAEPPAVEAAP